MGVEKDAPEESRECLVDVPWALRGELLVVPDILVGDVARGAGRVDILSVFGTDIMVEEVGEEVPDRHGGQSDHFLRFGVEVVREEGGSGSVSADLL